MKYVKFKTGKQKNYKLKDRTTGQSSDDQYCFTWLS